MLRVEEGRFAIFKIIILLGKKRKKKEEKEVDVWRNKWNVISLNHLLFSWSTE